MLERGEKLEGQNNLSKEQELPRGPPWSAFLTNLVLVRGVAAITDPPGPQAGHQSPSKAGVLAGLNLSLGLLAPSATRTGSL